MNKEKKNLWQITLNILVKNLELETNVTPKGCASYFLHLTSFAEYKKAKKYFDKHGKKIHKKDFVEYIENIKWKVKQIESKYTVVLLVYCLEKLNEDCGYWQKMDTHTLFLDWRKL